MQRKTATLNVEALESRQLLAGSVTLANGILSITGTGAANVASVATQFTAGVKKVAVTLDGVTSRFTYSTVRQILFRGQAGNDRFIAPANFALPIEAHGDGGNDTLTGGAAGDWLYGEAGTDTLNGNAGMDFMYGGDGPDTLNAAAGDDWVYGENGDDTLHGNGGEDNLFGGAGKDVLRGGFGNDILVSLDNLATDTLYGDVGTDSFWLDKNGTKQDAVQDAKSTEAPNIHAIARFANGADRTLNGDAIADPPADHFTNYADHWLFPSNGPSPDDIRQGGIGDCWLLAGLAATANLSSKAIRQTVVDLGDGTYAVSLGSKFYRVDADLPTTADNNGELIYAQLGREDTLWVGIIEKAFTMWRTNNSEYNSIDGGFVTKALRGVGSTNVNWNVFSAFANGEALLNRIDTKLADRKAVGIGIDAHPEGVPLVDVHAYTVIRINRDENGRPVSILLRNPWGRDGAGDDGNNDGYITLTADQLFQCRGDFAWGTVRA